MIDLIVNGSLVLAVIAGFGLWIYATFKSEPTG